MKHLFRHLRRPLMGITATLLILFAACTPRSSVIVPAGHTPDDDTCYAKGVSGAYSGFIDGRLIIAGGANFPHVSAAEGGRKVYYDGLYAASVAPFRAKKGSHKTVLHWERVGVLPMPLAYGVAVSDSEAMYFIGGMNGEGSSCEAFAMRREGRVLRVTPLPPLPFTMDNMAGALLDNTFIYVVGGNCNGKPSSGMYVLDSAKSEWFECSPVPGGPRVQPVCAAAKGHIYVWGGYCPASDSLAAFVHTDGWKYDLDSDSWTAVAAPVDESGAAVTLAGGCATTLSDGSVIAAGGVNKDVFLAALKGEYPSPEYLLHEAGWYRFNDAVYRFDPSTETWSLLSRNSRSARAGASIEALDSLRAIMMGGELMPGIRSTDVTLITNATNAER